MNRRLLIIVITLLAVGGAGVLLVRWYTDTNRIVFPALTEKELDAAALKLHGPAPAVSSPLEIIEASRRLRMAIGNIGLADENRSWDVSDLLLAELSTATGLEMVERHELEKVLNELRLSLSGLVRANDAVRAGKILRVDWFLLGTPAVVNGKKVAVIRIVNARTGVMRDATMIPQDENASALASRLATFVRQTRQDATAPKPKTYLAFGGFEDLSVNSRQANLPRDLRSYLTAAYQKSGVAVLEREFVSTLLHEVYLDLAGLTEESGTNAPVMQSAYWLVDGYYQTYETAGFEVEMMLNVRRIFGRSQSFELREKPGEPLFLRVKESIDGAVARGQTSIGVTLVSELKSQISTGHQLLDSVQHRMGGEAFGGWLDYTGQMSESEVARNRRNINEAIQALQTALLLDPGNRQAKSYLAGCFSTPFASQFDEARDLYREIIDAPVSDEWAALAQRELSWSFTRFVDPIEKQRWFDSAANRAVNKSAKEFFEKEARAAAEEVTLQQAGTTEAEKVAEERLFRDIRAWEADVKGHFHCIDFFNTGLGKYAGAFGTNYARAASRMVALLPRLQATATNLAPHILAGVVTFQVDTNAPIIADFQQSLDAFSGKPPPYPELSYYVELLSSPVYRWAEDHQLYRLAARLKEIHEQSADYVPGIHLDDEDRIAMAFNYLQTKDWQKALDVFQSYSNRPVMMGNSGLWGPAFSIILPSKQAALCRKKLGLPPVIDPREFDLGEPCLHPHSRRTFYDSLTFLTASDGLWVGLNTHVMHVGFNLQTNFNVPVLPDGSAPVAALSVGTSNVWIGTAGDGIVELEKTSHRTRHFTETDGLLMNCISALHLAGDTLWIGYGDRSRGALGKLELSSGRFTSFPPSLANKSPLNQPPGRQISEIHAQPSGDVWCIAHSVLLKCRPSENIWERQESEVNRWTTSYSLDNERLVQSLSLQQVELTVKPATNHDHSANLPVKSTWVMTTKAANLFEQSLKTNGSRLKVSTSVRSLPEAGELDMFAFSNGQHRFLPDDQKLPSPATALALQGHQLWAGGQGYLALVDLDENKIKKLAYIPTRAVDQIQIGGGWIWVQFNKHIYRASLQNLN